MPSTPRFVVTQNDEMVFVDINVPYVRVSEMEYTIDGTNFHFWCKPYLLNLTFPMEIVDDERAKAVYDMNKNHGTILVHLPKLHPGTHFPDLDLLTTLLQEKKWKPQDEGLPDALPKPPLIEVLDSKMHDVATTRMDEGNVPLPVATDSSLLSFESREKITINIGPPTYGFNNRFKDFFKCWHGEVSEIIALPEPDKIPAHERMNLQTATEDTDFDMERYLIDFANESEDEYFHEAMNYQPFWASMPITKSKPTLVMAMDAMSLDPPFEFNDGEKEVLRRLPNREHLLSRSEQSILLGGLCDILAAYAYDLRTTQGDATVESAWTIMITSSTLSWLNPNADLNIIAKSNLRRMLTYPLLRQHSLACQALNDVCDILQRGKRVVLRCLLRMYDILSKSETHYLLNTLYIEDYCVWIQRQSDKALLDLAAQFKIAVQRLQDDKDLCGWAIKHMEAALMAASSDEEESSSDDSDSSEDDN